MTKGISPVVIALAVAILAWVFLVVRTRRLKVEYSVLWIVGSLAALGAAIFYPAVKVIAPFLGVVYTPSAVFFSGIFFLIIVALHLSIKVSQLENDRVQLAQKVALLEARVTEIRGPGDAP